MKGQLLLCPFPVHFSSRLVYCKLPSYLTAKIWIKFLSAFVLALGKCSNEISDYYCRMDVLVIFAIISAPIYKFRPLFTFILEEMKSKSVTIIFMRYCLSRTKSKKRKKEIMPLPCQIR